jgi:hypothetical protein
MRRSLRALLVVLAIAIGCGDGLAAESGSKWWPFQRAEETVPPDANKTPFDVQTPAPTTPLPQQPVLPDETSIEDPNQKWMIKSPFGKVSWPRIHTPELPKRPSLPAQEQQAAADANRNSWVETPASAPKPSPLQSMSNSARTAWKKTVDALTPGDQTQPEDRSSRVARREGQSTWNRMFGADEAPKKEGSQTIGEFIAQERLDP